ncbi:MAG: type I restriction enzyme HsdR N-terminal domain-containing protein [Bacteroidetes bacterium]|nr:MAG: type I restriction enzyme HsdR N-terminal domain-containing protein [Bacteroidota bacterium]
MPIPPIATFLPQTVKKVDGIYIYDASRKKYLKLSPEEYVRQFCIYFLTKNYDFPLTLIQTEQYLTINQKPKRADIIAYKNQKPILVVECKAMEIKLSLKVFQQISTYQSQLDASYFMLTNGIEHIIFEKRDELWTQIEDLPNYHDI